MGAKLIAEEGVLKGLVLSLDEGEQWVIGRDPDACQLLVEDLSASRKHLICRSTPQGILVENLSQSNPVEVNDEVVNEPRLLHHGDAVKIGSGMYRFYAETGAHLYEEEEKNEKKEGQTAEEQQPQQQLEQEEKAHPEPELAHIEELTDETVTPEPEEVPEPVVPEPETPFEAISSPIDSAPTEEPRHNTLFEEEPPVTKPEIAEINFDIIDTGRWLLKVIGGPNNGAEFSMQNGTSYLIGTDPNVCDIVFHDTSVSRQHARITVSPEDTLFIEDLKSRNGTLVDGEPLKGKQPLATNTMISMGTTSFIVFDREGEMQTIISPLLPSIVKALQKEEPKPVESAMPPAVQVEEKPPEPVHHTAQKTNTAFGAFILIGIVTVLLVIIGIGISGLFQNEPVVLTEQVDTGKALTDALAPFPSVKSSFNKSTGKLLLVGHVLTATDKNQLMYNLQGLKFIKSLDDSGIIIDEYVWQELNPVLAKNPNWKGVNIQSSTPGRFVLSGYLQTRKQSDLLNDYINANFPYLDLLEKRVIVEEDVVNSVTGALQKQGIRDVSVQMSNGELTLTGGVPGPKIKDYNGMLAGFKEIPGVRSVKNQVTELAPEASMINLSDKYEVTGFSNQGSVNSSVLVNGKILWRGDILDGMTITSIKPNTIFLEKDGVKYKIDYSSK